MFVAWWSETTPKPQYCPVIMSKGLQNISLDSNLGVQLGILVVVPSLSEA